MLGEKSEETIVPMRRKPKDGWDNKTHSEGRVSTSTRFSEEVSDGACRKANSTTRQITRTPAQTILESQEADMERLDLICQVIEKSRQWMSRILQDEGCRRAGWGKTVRQSALGEASCPVRCGRGWKPDMVLVLRHSQKKWRATGLPHLNPGVIPWPYQRTCGSLRHFWAFFWLRVYTAPKQNPHPPTRR